MNNLEESLNITFQKDVDSIAKAFINCFGLKHSSEIDNLSDPLMRWLDFRLRYVDKRNRKVVFSNRFPKAMTDDVQRKVDFFTRKTMDGADLNPYQGKGLIIHNDISGNKRQKRTDLLWADWGILHFHLNDENIPENEYFANRSKWLLFALVGEDSMAVIDVRHHDDENLFSDISFLEIVANSWPDYMKQFELKGILATTLKPTSEEHAKLRNAGVSSCVTIGNKTYIGPGMGITSASTPLRVTLTMDNVRRYVGELAKTVCDPNAEFQLDVASNHIENPDFHLSITNQGIAIFESKLNKAWLFPKKIRDASFNYIAEIKDILAPDWAAQKVINIDVQK